MDVECFILDDTGRFWDAGSVQLRASLKGFGAGDGFADYVVRNLGFVRIDRRGESATIWLRPAVLAPRALASLIYWLVDTKMARILVNAYVNGEWQHTMLGAAETSFSALASLIRRAALQSSDGVISRPVSIASLDCNSPLARALQIWRCSEGRLSRIISTDAFGDAVGHRYSLFEAHNGAFVLHEFGAGLPKLAQVWLSQAIGQPIEDHPDHRYGTSCTASYRRAHETGQPELQHVDAYVSWPGTERHRRRYKRLLLPVSDGNRRQYLLSATAEDASINLLAIA